MDTGGVTMVDSVKVYVKTKEAFGWPEDNEDFPETAVASTKPSQTTTAVTNGMTNTDSDSSVSAPVPMTSIDR